MAGPDSSSLSSLSDDDSSTPSRSSDLIEMPHPSKLQHHGIIEEIPPIAGHAETPSPVAVALKIKDRYQLRWQDAMRQLDLANSPIPVRPALQQPVYQQIERLLPDIQRRLRCTVLKIRREVLLRCTPHDVNPLDEQQYLSAAQSGLAIDVRLRLSREGPLNVPGDQLKLFEDTTGDFLQRLPVKPANVGTSNLLLILREIASRTIPMYRDQLTGLNVKGSNVSRANHVSFSGGEMTLQIAHVDPTVFGMFGKTSKSAAPTYINFATSSFRISFSLKNLQTEVTFPDAYDAPELDGQMQSRLDMETSGIPGHQRDQAINVAKHVFSKLWGLMGPADQLKGFAETLVNRFLLLPLDLAPVPGLYIVYGGQPLFADDPSHSCIVPSAAVDKDAPGLPSLEIQNPYIKQRVQARITEEWLNRAKIAGAWLAGCRLLDLLEEEGEKVLYRICYCDALLHLCDGCCNPYPCSTLRRVDETPSRYCGSCKDLPDSDRPCTQMRRDAAEQQAVWKNMTEEEKAKWKNMTGQERAAEKQKADEVKAKAKLLEIKNAEKAERAEQRELEKAKAQSEKLEALRVQRAKTKAEKFETKKAEKAKAKAEKLEKETQEGAEKRKVMVRAYPRIRDNGVWMALRERKLLPSKAEKDLEGFKQKLEQLCGPITNPAAHKAFQKIKSCPQLSAEVRDELYWRWSGAPPLTQLTPAPFRSSVACINPMIMHKGQLRGHVAENTILMPHYLNNLQSVHPLIAVRIFWEFIQDNDLHGDRRQELIQRMEHLCLIQLQIPRKAKSRFGLKLTPANYASLQAQMRTGIADPSFCQNLHWPLLKEKKGYWDQEEGIVLQGRYQASMKVINACLEELKAKPGFRNEYLRYVNGIIFPSEIGPDPLVWRYRDLFNLMTKRLLVMTHVCNKDYLTTVTVETLVVLLCMQLVARRIKVDCPPKFVNTIDLPISLYRDTGLSLSFGKCNHHEEMKSGLQNRDERLESIKDFDIEELNIIAQTWSWNTALQDWDEWEDEIGTEFRAMPALTVPYWEKELAPLPEWDPRKVGIPPGMEADEDVTMEDEAADAEHDGDDGIAHDFPPDDLEESDDRSEQLDDGDEPPSLESSKAKGTFNTLDFRRNMTNKNNSCYASVSVQLLSTLPIIRDAVLHADSSICRQKTGIPIGSASDKTALRALFDLVKQLFQRLHEKGRPLTANWSDRLLNSLFLIKPLWKEGSMQDATEYFGELVDRLVEATDTSNPNPVVLQEDIHKELENLALKGQSFPRVDVEAFRYYEAIVGRSGITPILDALLTIWVAESPCGEPGCRAFGRSFQKDDWVLKVPEDEPNKIQTLVDLVADCAVGPSNLEVAVRCAAGHSNHVGCKDPMRRAIHIPKYLALQFPRLKADGTIDRTRIVTPLTLDLGSTMNAPLPSDPDGLHDINRGEVTEYRLAGMIAFRPAGRHYITYVREGPQLDSSDWMMLDDTKPIPTRMKSVLASLKLTEQSARAVKINDNEHPLVCLWLYIQNEKKSSRTQTPRKPEKADLHERPETSTSTTKPDAKKKKTAPGHPAGSSPLGGLAGDSPPTGPPAGGVPPGGPPPGGPVPPGGPTGPAGPPADPTIKDVISMLQAMQTSLDNKLATSVDRLHDIVVRHYAEFRAFRDHIEDAMAGNDGDDNMSDDDYDDEEMGLFVSE